MTTLAIGFSVGWAAVACYLGWIGVQQHRLDRRLDEVKRLAAPPDQPAQSSRAA